MCRSKPYVVRAIKLYSLGDFRLRRTSSCGAFSINGNGRPYSFRYFSLLRHKRYLRAEGCTLRWSVNESRDASAAFAYKKILQGFGFFVISLPWLEVKRWDLVFRAIDASGTVVASCRKSLDIAYHIPESYRFSAYQPRNGRNDRGS